MCRFYTQLPGAFTDLDWRPQPERVAGLVSVIVPTYDRAGIVCHALDSVRAQTHRPIELIVVDDGSTDDTAAALAAWAAGLPADDGLTLVCRHQPNGGAQRARNHGLLVARGETIQFLDSDDTLDPAKLALQVAHLEGAPEVDLSVGQTCALESPQTTLHAHRRYALRELLRRAAGWCPIQTAGPLIRARVFERADRAWDERDPWVHDWELFPRLLLQGHAFGYCLSARSYMRPEDGRARTGLHTRDRTSARYVEGRLLQLGSLWHHAPAGVRRLRAFRAAVALEGLRVALVMSAAADPAAVRDWLRVVARGTACAPLVSALRAGSPGRTAARLADGGYKRLCGVLGRLRRRLGPALDEAPTDAVLRVAELG